MTRTVYDNHMVAHVWASQSQDYGRSNNRNFFFNGRVLYSYGSHFVVGIAVGVSTFILNSDTYSISTSRHQTYAWRAAHGTILHVPNLTKIHRAILAMVDPNENSRTWAPKELRAYLEQYATGMSDEAGAWLYRLISKGDWSHFKARRIAAEAKAAREASKRAKRVLEAGAREVAAIPLAAFRLHLKVILNGDKWGIERALRALAKNLHHKHRAAIGKRTKAKVWQRLKLTRAAIDRMNRMNGSKYREARKAIHNLRKIQLEPDYRARINWRSGNTWSAIHDCLITIAKDSPGISSALRAKLDAGIERTARLAALGQILDDRKEQERKRAAEAKRFADEAEKRSKWLAGESIGYWRGSDEYGGALLRAIGAEIDGCNVNAGELQTSWGATVPLAHAVRAFRMIKRIRGTHWQANGKTIAVGHFQISEIMPSGDLIAGCHRINWPEIERLATQLGVFDCAPIAEESAIV